MVYERATANECYLMNVCLAMKILELHSAYGTFFSRDCLFALVVRAYVFAFSCEYVVLLSWPAILPVQ